MNSIQKSVIQDPSADPSTVLKSRIRDGLSRRVAVKKTLLRKRTSKKRMKYAKLQKNGLKISGSMFYGVMEDGGQVVY